MLPNKCRGLTLVAKSESLSSLATNAASLSHFEHFLARCSPSQIKEPVGLLFCPSLSLPSGLGQSSFAFPPVASRMGLWLSSSQTFSSLAVTWLSLHRLRLDSESLSRLRPLRWSKLNPSPPCRLTSICDHCWRPVWKLNSFSFSKISGTSSIKEVSSLT